MTHTPGQKVAMTDESACHYDNRCNRLQAVRQALGGNNTRPIGTPEV
jgi:hypothetical protein